MFILVGNPLTSEFRIAAASFRGQSLSRRTLRSRSVVRVLCSASSSSPACAFPSQRVAVDDMQRASSAGVQTQSNGRIGRIGGRSRTTTRVASLSSPLFSDDAQNGASKKAHNGGAAANRSPKVEVFAKGKWKNTRDSSLSDDEPLPLPMTWPDSEPASKEKIDSMLSCNPETQTCKSVIYQWTGDCKRCQGTGLVSFYRKRREVIGKCMNCLGIGSVHKITSRANIQEMDDGSQGIQNIDDDTNGSSNGSARTDRRT